MNSNRKLAEELVKNKEIFQELLDAILLKVGRHKIDRNEPYTTEDALNDIEKSYKMIQEAEEQTVKLCIDAVLLYGGVLEIIDEKIKTKNDTVCLIAMITMGDITHVPADKRRNFDIIDKVKCDIKNAPRCVKAMAQCVYEKLIMEDASMIKEVPQKYQNYTICELVLDDEDCEELVQYIYKPSYDICLRAIEINPNLIKRMKNVDALAILHELPNHPELLEYCVCNSNYNIQYNGDGFTLKPNKI